MDGGKMGVKVELSTVVRAVMFSSGIVLSLVIYAYCQERIMTQPYELADGEKRFADTVFLVLVNRCAAAAAAAVFLVFMEGWKGLRPQAPINRFPVISLANLLATTCQYEALKFITLPTQTLLKCSKLIPVMVLSALLSKKKYSVVDYGAAATVVLGTMSFMSGNIHSRVSTAQDSWIGIAFMGGNIFFDSFLMAYQERLFTGYSLSSNSQMLYVNLFSSVLAMLTCVHKNSLPGSLELLRSSGKFRIDLLLLTSSAVAAQFFITGAIKEFGAVFFGTVVTVQQVSSVVLSSLVLGTVLTLQQWFSCATVFGALFAKNLFRFLTNGMAQMRAARELAQQQNPPLSPSRVVDVDCSHSAAK